MSRPYRAGSRGGLDLGAALCFAPGWYVSGRWPFRTVRAWVMQGQTTQFPVVTLLCGWFGVGEMRRQFLDCPVGLLGSRWDQSLNRWPCSGDVSDFLCELYWIHVV
jgi:hypothetical protein